jgi:hypothetical protein
MFPVEHITIDAVNEWSRKVIRQQMGHSTESMTRLYSGEIPIEQVQAEFSKKRRFPVQLENMENEAAA